MNRFFVLLVAVLLVAAFGCSENPNPAQPTGTVEIQSDAPASSGVVTRDGYPIGVTWIDVKSGLRVVLGANMDEFCAGIVNFDIIPYQDVNLADDRVLTIGGGNVQATVWDFLAFDCALFTSVAPVAHGFATVALTDNDLYGVEPGQPYANAWGWMAHGVLTRTDGSPTQFGGHVRNIYSEAAGFHSSAKVRLQKPTVTMSE